MIEINRILYPTILLTAYANFINQAQNHYTYGKYHAKCDLFRRKNVPDYSASREKNDLGYLTFDLQTDILCNMISLYTAQIASVICMSLKSRNPFVYHVYL
jgi:hypothetical protein